MKSYKKNCLVILLAIVFVINNTIFANQKSVNSIKEVDTGSVNDIFETQTNGVLNKLMALMNNDDAIETKNLINKYFAGNKDSENDLKNILSKYITDVNYALHYILDETTVVPFAEFVVGDDLKIFYSPIKGVHSDTLDEESLNICEDIWTVALKVWDINDLSKIKALAITDNKISENAVAINPLDDKFVYWKMSIDKSLINDKVKLKRNMITALTFYHAFNAENIEWENPKKTLYTMYGQYYKLNSPINKFYKMFWKGRRYEYNVNQYDLYSNDYVSEKASRTCFDDFAESFYVYIQDGVDTMRSGMKTQKQNFFDDYEEYRNLAVRLRNIY